MIQDALGLILILLLGFVLPSLLLGIFCHILDVEFKETKLGSYLRAKILGDKNER